MPMPDRLRIDIAGGKYTVIQEYDGKFYALRYGEAWRDLTGDKLVLAMAYELDLLRTSVKDPADA